MGHRGCECLTAGEDLAHRGQTGGGIEGLVEEHCEQRRDELDGGDPFIGDDPGQVGRVPVPVGCSDHGGRAGDEGPEQLPDRRVEGVRRLHQHPFVRRIAGVGPEPGQHVVQTAMRDRHALGLSGRAGCEERVHRVPAAQRRRPVRVGHGRGLRGGERVEIDRDQGARPGSAGGDRLGPARDRAGDDDRRRTGQRELPADDIRRRLRIERHVRSTGEHDPVDRDQHLDRSRHADRDGHVRPDSPPQEGLRERMDQCSVLGVVQGATVGANRRPGRVARERLCQRIGNRHGRLGQRGGAAPPVEYRVFGRGHQIGIADGRRRVCRQGVEEPDEPVGEETDRLDVVQVGRVEHRSLPVVPVVGDPDGQVDPSGQVMRFDRCDGQTAALPDRQRLGRQIGDGRLVEGEPHLRQRGVGLGAHRVHPFDDRLERDVRVGKSLEIGATDVVEQPVETGRQVDPGAEDQGVDEHADHRVEDRLPAPGDRRADGDVLGRRQARQQHREGPMRHHERGESAIAGQPRDTLGDMLRHSELDACSALGGDRGPRSVGGQLHDVGRAVELPRPVLQLGPDERGVVGRGTEHAPLPQCDVGHLDRQRPELGCVPGNPRGVRGDQIGHQRREGLAIARDVVHDHPEDRLGVRETGEAHAHREFGNQVESAEHHLGQHRFRHVAPVEHRGCRGRLVDELVGLAIELGVGGAQDLVTRHDVEQRLTQSSGVDAAGQLQHHRDVVGRRRRIEAVDEPHPLLCERQRDAVRTRGDGFDRRQPRSFRGGGQREVANRRGIEEVPDGEVDAERLRGAADDAGGQQRVAADVEDRLHDADVLETEHLREDVPQGCLGVVLGRDELGRRCQHRTRQCAAIEFAVLGQRQPLDRHHDVGDHVLRHRGRDTTADELFVDLDARLRNHVGGQDFATIGQIHDVGRTGRDPVEAHQRGLDLPVFDAEAAELDLGVATTEVLDVVADAARQIAGPVHAVTGIVGRERIRDEARGTETSPSEVSLRELRSGDVHLADDTLGHRPQPRVEDVDVQRRQRSSDERRVPRRHRGAVQGAVADMHRGLGDAVHVDQLRRVGRVVVEPAPDLLETQRLATEYDVAQRECGPLGPLCGDELVERRRRLTQHRDPLGLEEVDEGFRIPRRVLIDDDDTPAGHEGSPDLPDREVEGVRMEQRPHVLRPEREFLGRGLHQRDDLAVRDDDTLRLARRTGCVDQVGRQPVVESLGLRCPRCPLRGPGRQIPGRDKPHIDDIPRRGELRVGEHQQRRGVVDDRLRAGDRLGAVERQIRRPGLEDGQQGHDQLGPARERHADQAARAGTGRAESAGQRVGLLVEFAIGQHCPGRVADRQTVGMASDGRAEESGQRTEVGAADEFQCTLADERDRPPGGVGDLGGRTTGGRLGLGDPGAHRGLGVEALGDEDAGRRRHARVQLTEGDRAGHRLVGGLGRCNAGREGDQVQCRRPRAPGERDVGGR